MGRYGPAPETTAPPPPPPTDDSRTRWSVRAKILSVLAGLGMLAAFIFNFLSPTSNGFKKDTTTTVARQTPTTLVSPSTAPPTTTATPTTAFSTTVPGGTASR